MGVGESTVHVPVLPREAAWNTYATGGRAVSDTRIAVTATRTLNRSPWIWSIGVLLGSFAQLGCSAEGPNSGLAPALPGDPTAIAPTVGAPVGTTPAGTPTTGNVPGVPGVTPPNTPVTPGTPTTTVTPGTPVPPVTPVVDGPPPPDEPSAGFIRRLTHIEFDNTIADLLGIEGQPSSGFASDIALQGFTNNAAGQNVTPTLAEQYIDVVEDLSRQATANLNGRLGCDPVALGEEACVQQFITSFGKSAWRRPLTTDEQMRALELFLTARGEYELEVAVQMVIQYFLLSPHFIYLMEPLPAGAVPGSIVPLDGWKVATRLSYFLLGSMPDDTLFAAAEAGTLNTPEGVASEARRLLQQERARQRIGLFFTEWLRLRTIDKLQKDSTLFPDFDLSVGPLLREQVELFAQAVILDDQGTAADLFTAPFTFVNTRIASYYGVNAPAGSTMARVDLDPAQRGGLLTHAALLATFAHQNQTDPVTRGKFVRESVLCESVPAPPVGLVVTTPEVVPGATTRERFAQHQEDPNCSGCHLLMDPIGLGFENYDPIGKWRDMDNDLPVDASGEIIGSDVAGTFNGALELSQKLAGSKQAMECMSRTWLRFALGRSEQAADRGALAVIDEQFGAAEFKMAELLVAVTETNTFRSQRVLDPNVSALEDASQEIAEDAP